MERVETRELEYFVAVAEELHFGRAAERLGIAQPPLSRAISRLERRIGVRLLERTSRRVDLTAAGAAFLTDSRKVLTAMAAAVSRAQGSRHPHRLVVATRSGTASQLLSSVLRAYRRQSGDVDVVFAKDQVDFVRNGSADVALTCGRSGLEDLHITELAEDKTVALLPLDHALAARSSVSAAQLTRDPLFRTDWAESSLEETIDKVAMGELIVMMAVSATDRAGSAVVAVPVVDAPTTRLVLTWRPDVPAAARDRFMDIARSVASRHTIYGQGPNWVAPPSTVSSMPVT
jgi:DNA-binding transcriptional LysR family regulator